MDIEANQSTSIEAYLSCRLIPLDKNPGVQPIGIVEAMRRIIGKSIIYTIKPRIRESAGDLQPCAGQRPDCEVAIHAMSQIFTKEETNAFYSKVMLHNIQYICPALAVYTQYCYATPSRLFAQGGKEIASVEGTTQGDPISMPLYAVTITPLLQIINVAHEVRNVAFADDLSCADRLVQLRLWWDNIVTHSSPLGYYPRADKSWLRLIVKAGLLVAAEESFEETDRCALIHRQPQVPWWSHRL